MITAGTGIGAGMFSLPIVSSGMWFGYSVIALIFTWYLNYISSLYVLELNLRYMPGASFDTITKKILGKNWNIVVNLFIGFLMYILLYAYFSAFGNIISDNIKLDRLPDYFQNGIGLLFGLILAFTVWYSGTLAGRISSFLVMGMVATFIFSMAGLTIRIDFDKLMDSGSIETSYFKYIWMALPYYVTSFGFVTIVPSLYKIYGEETFKIKQSLLWGSIIILAIYTLFIIVAFGNISRVEFLEINKNGGNVAELIKGFNAGKEDGLLNGVLNLFSNFAIITSFLGIGLSLFDFVADKFSFSNSKMGRLKTAMITFLPSGIASFFFPNGFIVAIGYAGLICILGFFIAPFFMVRKVRKDLIKDTHLVFGGRIILLIFLLSSILIAFCQVLAMFNCLPKW